MMNDMTRSVERLTMPWSDVLGPRETGLSQYTPIDHSPLLDMLDDACRSNFGNRGGSGSDPAVRSLIDMEAFMLRNRIEGTVKTWIEHLGRQKPKHELKAAVVQLAGILQAHHAAKSIPDSEYTRVVAFFPRWCEQIWRLLDPPVVKELVGACPNPDCEKSEHVDELGVKGSALIVFYIRGTENVKAKCRACAWEWGQDQLRLLGEWLGASQDHEFMQAAGL